MFCTPSGVDSPFHKYWREAKEGNADAVEALKEELRAKIEKACREHNEKWLKAKEANVKKTFQKWVKEAHDAWLMDALEAYNKSKISVEVKLLD